MSMSRFSEIPKANLTRSSFNRSFDSVTTIDSGFLCPIFVDEVYPGDTHNLDMDLFARLTTPVVPVMSDIYVDTFYFFVPSRLVWDNFERFQGAQDNPGDSIDYLIPQLIAPDAGFPTQSVADYMGIPTNVANTPRVNALPFRALNLIYNEWFRDENLQDSLPVPKGDGPDTWLQYEADGETVKTDENGNQLLTYPLFRRGKRHDYFTSALPWPQKGIAVDLPLGLTAPVVGNGFGLAMDYGTVSLTDPTVVTGNLGVRYSSGVSGFNVGFDPSYGPADTPIGVRYTTGTGIVTSTGESGRGAAVNVTSDPEKTTLFADLTESTAATVQSVREAFLLQAFFERAARTGTRYTEILRGFWNVVAPDFRLQRPELLGGSTGRMAITTVPQTSSTDSTSPQANLAAFGVYADTGKHGFTKSFVEHGYIIGFVNVRTPLKYQQGLDRMWSRRTRFDFPMPQFAHLGEQPILNQEIFMQGTDVVDDNGDQVNEGVFGYAERFAEIRYKNSTVTGKMRSSDPQSLDVWHLAQNFENLPRLNSEFIEDHPPIERLVAVQDEPQFKLEISGHYNSVREFPVHSIPGFMPYL